jgi:hypothetical protein
MYAYLFVLFDLEFLLIQGYCSIAFSSSTDSNIDCLSLSVSNMSIIRQKDGHPNVKFFESIETLAQFDTIRKALQKKELKKIFGDDQSHLSKEHIAQLVIQLLHFQEEQLGKQSNGSASLIRIPVGHHRS